MNFLEKLNTLNKKYEDKLSKEYMNDFMKYWSKRGLNCKEDVIAFNKERQRIKQEINERLSSIKIKKYGRYK